MSRGEVLDLYALLRRETILSFFINALVSVGFFFLVFGWAPVRGSALAIDFLPQTFGITCLGGLVPSLIMLARISKGAVVPVGPVPTRAAQLLRVLGCAMVAMPLLGGLAALLMLAFGPVALSPPAALIVKTLYGGLAGIVTTPPILRKALGMSYWPSIRRPPIFAQRRTKSSPSS
ncbi:hypothetical protein FHS31_000341 [Sphingomonas vulcanisoli]|uniref:Uncharacterized protein n=1 Tax=Sphingomonas vulcanisoli TaxID=1658060 RepID=A0ABX0TML0_9SPHN|nr:hypothetical protein [Sphingomonas vulcanisoli]NIJ06759.1 hypothetical protein [Sphingomonas vulcanisoli]